MGKEPSSELSKPIIVNTPEGLANAIIRLSTKMETMQTTLAQLLGEWQASKQIVACYVTHADCLKSREDCARFLHEKQQQIGTSQAYRPRPSSETKKAAKSSEDTLGKTQKLLAVLLLALTLLTTVAGGWWWSVRQLAHVEGQLERAKVIDANQAERQERILKLLNRMEERKAKDGTDHHDPH